MADNTTPAADLFETRLWVDDGAASTGDKRMAQVLVEVEGVRITELVADDDNDPDVDDVEHDLA